MTIFKRSGSAHNGHDVEIMGEIKGPDGIQSYIVLCKTCRGSGTKFVKFTVREPELIRE
jgi:hypothetical protein